MSIVEVYGISVVFGGLAALFPKAALPLISIGLGIIVYLSLEAI